MAKDYLKELGPQTKVTKHQEGGAPGAPAPAGGEGAGGGGGDQMQQMLMQVVETQDPNAALQFCNMLAEQMGLAGGGGAPQGGAPVARNGMRLGTPIFSTGGKLVG